MNGSSPPVHGGFRVRWSVLLAAVVALVVSMSLVTPANAAPSVASITLSSVGSRYTNADITIKGSMSGNLGGGSVSVSTQRNINGTWTTLETKTVSTLGAYLMSPQQVATPGTAQFRTQASSGGTVLATSSPISVTIIAGGPSVPSAHISVNSVGSRAVGADIPIKGWFGDTDAAATKAITVQRLDGAVWTDQGTVTVTGNGSYTATTQKVTSGGNWQFRTRMNLNTAGGTPLATSAPITVTVTGSSTPPPPPPPPGVTGTISLSSVGSRYVGGSVPLNGSFSGTAGTEWNLVGQVKLSGNWAEVTHKHGVTTQGKYAMGPVVAPTTPGTYQYRTLLYYNESVLVAASNEISVVVKALVGPPPPPPPPDDLTNPNKKPAPVEEERFLDGAKKCETLSVQVAHQKRTNNWAWDAGQGKWVPAWTMWMTHHNTVRQATAADCVNVVGTLASDVLLPDIRIKQLNKCGAGDLAATNGTCFKIVNPAPFVSDFPHLAGKKLLKFPVLTMNAGNGPAEVIADRSSPNESQWKAYQTFYRPNGERQSQVAPGVKFYFAGDGHNHWHFTDFDDYWLEKLDGTRIRSAEKHGYCLLDNTSLTSLQGQPGVPAEPVYVEATTCGEGLPNALTILQGLSKGWGDTYPTSLPDQALDITGLPDGRYRVGVTADAIGAIREVNESNNTATIEVQISGNTVSIYPATAQGGVL